MASLLGFLFYFCILEAECCCGGHPRIQLLCSYLGLVGAEITGTQVFTCYLGIDFNVCSKCRMMAGQQNNRFPSTPPLPARAHTHTRLPAIDSLCECSVLATTVEPRHTLSLRPKSTSRAHSMLWSLDSRIYACTYSCIHAVECLFMWPFAFSRAFLVWSLNFNLLFQ